MNINIIILSFIILYLISTKLMQRSEIKRLKNRLENKRRKVNELIVDSKNKIVILHLEHGTITSEMIERITQDFQDLKKKGYYVIVLDKTFNVTKKYLSSETATKLKSELNNSISGGE